MFLDRLDTAIAFAVVMLGVSLLIIILTQMISTALGLRGTNLLWGIKTILTSLDPALKDHAETLATKILHDPLISDSIFSGLGGLEKWPKLKSLIDRWRLATAIGPGELVRCLRKIAADPEISTPAADAIKAILADAQDLDAARRIDLLKNAVGELKPGYAVQVDKMVQQVYTAAEQSVGKLEIAFNTVMDRVSQRFTMHMRLWTVVIAFLAVFVVHLDSFQLLNQLSTNPEARAALVSIRESMLNEATAILPAQGGHVLPLANSIAPETLKQAMEKLKKGEPDAAGIGDIPSFSTSDEAVQWLAVHLPADMAPDRKDALAGAYRRFVIAGLKEHADNINKQLAQAGFQIIRSPYQGLIDWEGWRHFLGQLVTAAFLSLGAPFWFNALRSLSNLRSVVASKQEQA